MSDVIQTAIASSISEWLQTHPAVLRLVQLLLWASNHPIWGLVMFIIVVAIAFSLIKALGRLLEILGLSILKAPFNFVLALIGFSFKSLGTLGGSAFQQLPVAKNAEPPALQDSNSQSIENDKQQRLADISTRLEAIKQEQNELLQEVADLIKSDV
ncbi:MAG: hypothetical protein KME08_20005 [Aphanothece sp. CMT-3BRIN-NPC111]|jgi:hypothetical protein|nr:hypothetical protein [Aphanothece sp. CMT-3BRIN-NPC111]